MIVVENRTLTEIQPAMKVIQSLLTIIVFVALSVADASAGRWDGFEPRVGTLKFDDRPEWWTFAPGNRAEAQDAYWQVYVPNAEVPFSSTSNPATLTPGVTSPAYRQAGYRIINYHRYYAWDASLRVFGAEANELAADFFGAVRGTQYANATVQDALEASALVLSVNQRLSHDIDASWTGYTALAAAGAGGSLALTGSPPAGINRFIEGFLVDSGANNFAGVGHRYSLLSRSGKINLAVASGGSASVMSYFDNDLAPESSYSADYPSNGPITTWPAHGSYIPYQWIARAPVSEGLRCSAWLKNVKEDSGYSGAVVAVTRNGTPMTVSNVRLTTAGLTWDLAIPDIATAPAVDHVYTVKISGLPGVYAGQTVTYSFTVFDPAKTVKSLESWLPSTPIVALSTRGTVGAGDNVMIAGFIVQGDEPLRVALRARGPSLRALGVGNAGNDPKVTIMRWVGDKYIEMGSLDNWKDSPNWRMVESFDIHSPDDRDAIVVCTVTPGTYTAIVEENDQSKVGGVCIVEMFNIDPHSKSRLAHVSTRDFCGTGENALIAGLSLQTRKTLVVRATGPSMKDAGVANAISSTKLIVHKLNPNKELAQRTSWQVAGNERLNGDLSWAKPKHEKEAAIVITLDPGLYSFTVEPADGVPGVALVEVFSAD